MRCVPTARLLVGKFAIPPTGGTVPSETEPSIKVTSPSEPTLPDVVVTVALKISGVPNATGLTGENLIFTVVATGPELALAPGVPLISAAPARPATPRSCVPGPKKEPPTKPAVSELPT